jgi:hypothetical protein
MRAILVVIFFVRGEQHLRPYGQKIETAARTGGCPTRPSLFCYRLRSRSWSAGREPAGRGSLWSGHASLNVLRRNTGGPWQDAESEWEAGRFWLTLLQCLQPAIASKQCQLIIDFATKPLACHAGAATNSRFPVSRDGQPAENPRNDDNGPPEAVEGAGPCANVPSTVLGGRDREQQVRLQALMHTEVTLGLSLGLRRNMKPDLMIVR